MEMESESCLALLDKDLCEQKKIGKVSFWDSYLAFNCQNMDALQCERITKNRLFEKRQANRAKALREAEEKGERWVK